MLVLVSYDVSFEDPGGKRRLRRIARICTNYGQRVQYSVFECVVDPAQWAALRAQLLEAFDAALLDTLQKHSIDVVVLAGFLSVLGEKVIAAYRNKIINVHPSLIPSFCGPGFYGLRVHEAALARGVKLTGATVHLVNEECDGGPILLQKAVAVEPGDTPETLQKRVMVEAEWQLLPKALAMVCSDEM